VERLRTAGDRHAVRVLALGLAGIGAYNAWRWREDYALALALRAERARPRPALKGSPKVTILVAAWNEAGLVERHIQSVLALRYPNKEYILCAGGADGTHEIARRHAGPGVTILEQLPGEGKQRALRQAFRHATGEIVYLTDADCLVDDDSFERVIAPIVDGGEAATTGASMPPPEQVAGNDFALYQWAVQRYAGARAPRYVTGLLGRNAAVRRDALERAGAFDAGVPAGTDYHLAKALVAAGYRIVDVPSSRAVTPYAATWARYAGQQRRWIRNVVLLGVRNHAWAEVRRNLQTSLTGAAMLLAPLAAPLAGRLLLIAWLLALAHSTAAKLRYLAFGRALDGTRRLSPLRLLAYTLAEFAVWALPLLDYPSEARRRRW
jgi:GT2 family glycosyltransferase